ncbi:MAG: hypothetical protein EB023_15000 [Flavobacteriia bacterium]|nr:hypothetical protein [Flavobacteriia bacterium]
MNLLKISCFLLLFLLITSSCNQTYVGGYMARPNLTINYNVPADLKIDTSIVLQGTSLTTIYFGIFHFGDNEFYESFGTEFGGREKSAASYKALTGTGNDILVNPKYYIQVKKGLLTKKIQATVCGYGAKIILR